MAGVIFDEVIGTVADEVPPPAPTPEAGRPAARREMDTARFAAELRRLARRAARLQAE